MLPLRSWLRQSLSLRSRFVQVFMLVLYKAKIILLGFIIKQIFKYTTPIEYSTWLMGHASIYASVFWDVLITKAIMDNVQRRAQGVTVSLSANCSTGDRSGHH